MLTQVLSTLETGLEGRVAMIHFRREFMSGLSLKDIETEDIIAVARSIDGVQVVLFFKEIEEDYFRVSIRSRDEFSARQVAQAFQGGGHDHAAGFFYRGGLAAAKKRSGRRRPAADPRPDRHPSEKGISSMTRPRVRRLFHTKSRPLRHPRPQRHRPAAHRPARPPAFRFQQRESSTRVRLVTPPAPTTREGAPTGAAVRRPEPARSGILLPVPRQAAANAGFSAKKYKGKPLYTYAWRQERSASLPGDHHPRADGRVVDPKPWSSRPDVVGTTSAHDLGQRGCGHFP
jgi:hypothetical protein